MVVYWQNLFGRHATRFGVMLQVPFGGSFRTELQWAAVAEGPGQCRLRVTGRVIFTKACLMRGLIEGHALQVGLFVPIHPPRAACVHAE